MFKKKIERANGQYAFQEELETHFIDYIPAEEAKMAFITFEPSMPVASHQDPAREVWGEKFLRELGVSVFGIKPRRRDWYRSLDIHDFFRNQEFINLVQSHERVFLYGGSMGGFGALTFARSFPGCSVIAFAPQTTMHPDRVPWETRFAYVKRLNWDTDFADAAEGLDQVKQAYIVYDPFCRLDHLQIMRLPQENVKLLKFPFVGHLVVGHLRDLGLLKDTVRHCIDGTVEDWFPKAIRARKDNTMYLGISHYFKAERLFKYGYYQEAREALNIMLRTRPTDKHAIRLDTKLRKIEETAIAS